MRVGRLQIDWFGMDERKSLVRGPRWFVSRGANFLYVSLGGCCSVVVPWFWSRAAIEARARHEGWMEGVEAGQRLRDDS